MTVAFSAVAHIPELPPIVMTVDSAITNAFQDGNKYSKGRKHYTFVGIGCVTTWGSQDGNKIGDYLRAKELSANQCSIIELADFVEEYLVTAFRPKETGKDEVGFHVAGFNQNGAPHLYHIFFGYNRPRNPEEKSPDYYRIDHTPGPMQISLLYNGRNDLVDNVVSMLGEEIQRGTSAVYDIRRPSNLIFLADFIVRFASEITFEVGPPYLTNLISPHNTFALIRNDDFSPVDRRLVTQKLLDLGYQVEGATNPHDNVIQSIKSVLRNAKTNGVILTNYIQEPPSRIYLDEDLVVHPDVIWTSRRQGRCNLDENNRWFGPPDLVIEVIARGRAIDDLRNNFEIYEEFGVLEYWIVDYLEKYILVWTLRDDKFVRFGVFGIGDEGFHSDALSYYVTQEAIEEIFLLSVE